jgi:hypothetical protein
LPNTLVVAKVVYGPIESAKSRGKVRAVPMTRVRNLDGKLVAIWTVDADSRTFEDDLSYAFRQHVKKVRRENKVVIGGSKRASRKG